MASALNFESRALKDSVPLTDEEAAMLRARNEAAWSAGSDNYCRTVSDKGGFVMGPIIGQFVKLAKAALEGNPNPACLDIASGPGEPAFSIAAAVPGAIVTATDLAEGMVKAARSRACDSGLSNVKGSAPAQSAGGRRRGPQCLPRRQHRPADIQHGYHVLCGCRPGAPGVAPRAEAWRPPHRLGVGQTGTNADVEHHWRRGEALCPRRTAHGKSACAGDVGCPAGNHFCCRLLRRGAQEFQQPNEIWQPGGHCARLSWEPRDERSMGQARRHQPQRV